jgi:hypothetical protein
MTIDREGRRLAFLAKIRENGRSRPDGIIWAAELLHVSRWTVQAWLKPESSKSASALPMWATELLNYKEKNHGNALV